MILNNEFFGTFAFTPVVDGDFIKDSPSKLLKEGKLNGVRTQRRHPYLSSRFSLLTFFTDNILLTERIILRYE